jgi:hypothetical protein
MGVPRWSGDGPVSSPKRTAGGSFDTCLRENKRALWEPALRHQRHLAIPPGARSGLPWDQKETPMPRTPRGIETPDDDGSVEAQSGGRERRKPDPVESIEDEEAEEDEDDADGLGARPGTP